MALLISSDFRFSRLLKAIDRIWPDADAHCAFPQAVLRFPPHHKRAPHFIRSKYQILNFLAPTSRLRVKPRYTIWLVGGRSTSWTGLYKSIYYIPALGFCLFVCSGFFRNSNKFLFFSWCTILSFMQSECHGPKTYENDTCRGATSPRDYGGIPGHFHSCGKSKLFSHFISHRFFVVALWHDDHGWHLWSLLLCTWHHFTR